MPLPEISTVDKLLYTLGQHPRGLLMVDCYHTSIVVVPTPGSSEKRRIIAVVAEDAADITKLVYAVIDAETNDTDELEDLPLRTYRQTEGYFVLRDSSLIAED